MNVVIERQHREALSQVGCGMLSINVETVRFKNISIEYRLCTMCDQNGIVLYCIAFIILTWLFITKYCVLKSIFLVTHPLGTYQSV